MADTLQQHVHIEACGHGPEIVLVHGWGMHGGIWDSTAAALASEFRVLCVDLPGHGHSPPLAKEYTLANAADAVATAVSAQLAGPAVWLGWSLGGLIALQVALTWPASVRALGLIAATPRFTTGEDWHYGVKPSVLGEFAHALTEDYRSTLNQFLTLQTLHSTHAREEVRHLRAKVFERGEPHPRALLGGVEVLKTSDLRSRLPQLSCPVFLLGGERDTLVPPAALRETAKSIPDAKVSIQPGASHAPFLSDAKAFLDQLRPWLNHATR